MLWVLLGPAWHYTSCVDWVIRFREWVRPPHLDLVRINVFDPTLIIKDRTCPKQSVSQVVVSY